MVGRVKGSGGWFRGARVGGLVQRCKCQARTASVANVKSGVGQQRYRAGPGRQPPPMSTIQSEIKVVSGGAVASSEIR